MLQKRCPRSPVHPPALATAVLAAILAGGTRMPAAYAQGTTPAPAPTTAAAAPWPKSDLNDTWKGTTLDPKWNVTLVGDAQANASDSSVKLDGGLLHLMVNSSDTFNGGDNGIYLWQPANGDFQVTLEIHNVTFTADAAKIGIMVRSSLSQYSPNAFSLAMPKGGNLQLRQPTAKIGTADTGPSSGCPGANCVPWGDATMEDPNRPVILQRLTRMGDTFTEQRSYDMGKTWGGVHQGTLTGQDTGTVKLGDDVLVGIWYTTNNSAGGAGEAVLGPISFTQMATRPTGSGLLAATAVDANSQPVADVGLTLNSGTTMLGTTLGMDDSSNPIASDTASFFLKPGMYTLQAAENDTYNAGAPVPLEIKAAGDVQELKVPVGKAK
jgi:hypothetical protein